MHTTFKNKIYLYLLISALLSILVLSGCDDYQTVSFDNQTKSIIKPFISSVSINFAGDPNQEYIDPKVYVEVGQSKKYVAPISKTKDNGALRKYVVVVKNEKDEIVYSHVLTWDELHEMNWIIVIIEKNL
jgi:hypothetical protein